MRRNLWKWITKVSKQQEGAILPAWLIGVRALIYPKEFICWRLSKCSCYRADSDTWLINGIEYSSAAMDFFANANGEIYRIKRTGDIITIEKVSNNMKLQTAIKALEKELKRETANLHDLIKRTQALNYRE